MKHDGTDGILGFDGTNECWRLLSLFVYAIMLLCVLLTRYQFRLFNEYLLEKRLLCTSSLILSIS